MERVTLDAEIREKTGKSTARKLRAAGKVPGVVYAKNTPSVHVSADRRQLAKIIHHSGGNVLIDLKLPEAGGAQEQLVIIKEIQHDNLKGDIVHVDFQQIKLSEKIRVHVPLATKGDVESPGVKAGGILERIIRELEVECLPAAIPKELVIDVSQLDIGRPVHVREITLPEGVEAITAPEQIAVLIKMAAAEKPAEEKPAEEEAAEPEIIKQKKREEENEEEAKAGAKKEGK